MILILEAFVRVYRVYALWLCNTISCYTRYAGKSWLTCFSLVTHDRLCSVHSESLRHLLFSCAFDLRNWFMDFSQKKNNKTMEIKLTRGFSCILSKSATKNFVAFYSDRRKSKKNLVAGLIFNDTSTTNIPL